MVVHNEILIKVRPLVHYPKTSVMALKITTVVPQRPWKSKIIRKIVPRGTVVYKALLNLDLFMVIFYFVPYHGRHQTIIWGRFFYFLQASKKQIQVKESKKLSFREKCHSNNSRLGTFRVEHMFSTHDPLEVVSMAPRLREHLGWLVTRDTRKSANPNNKNQNNTKCWTQHGRNVAHIYIYIL